jgi:hypothetical protein
MSGLGSPRACAAEVDDSICLVLVLRGRAPFQITLFGPREEADCALCCASRIPIATGVFFVCWDDPRINIQGVSRLMDNPYQKLEKIGAGSFSTVYKGSGEGAG